MPNPEVSIRTARLALAISFGVCCLLGGALVFFFWKNTSLATASGSSAVFVVIMAAVHFMGYRLLQRQMAASDTKLPPRQPLGEGILPAIKFGLVIQIVLFILTALVLDGGEMNKLCIMVIIAYWIGVSSILVRRGASPTKLDLLFIRYGMFVLFVLTPFITRIVYGIIGDSPLNGWQRWFGKF
jgi:hypothetical protein